MRQPPIRAMQLLLVALAFFVYRAAWSAYFFDDDFQWLVGTWAFRPVQLLGVGQTNHFFRPVIDLYFVAATPLFAGSPALFHLANIVLHAVNVLLLFALARALSGDDWFAFLAAVFFAVQPADVDTVAWVSALAEGIGALFGSLMLLWFVQFRRSGAARWRWLSVGAFVLALLTHESSVMFLALALLVDWLIADRSAPESWPHRLRSYAPYVIAAALYLAVDLTINSRHYVVTEGHYAPGLHILTNLRDYVIALYVGKGDMANYALVVGVFAAVLLAGSRRAKFAAMWVLLALLPFVSFRWGTTSRYLYLPAMGFGMLLAEGAVQLGRLLAGRLPRVAAGAIVALLALAVTVRFAAFAGRNVASFAHRTEAYRDYVTRFRMAHQRVVPYSRFPAGSMAPDVTPRFLTPLVQWEYRDPTIEIVAP